MKRPSKAPSALAPQQVRILGGIYKRSVLPVVKGSRGAAGVEGLRPTLARVRQTLFDWLGHDLTGWRVLDAFAGTGALGFEAASRGAASVLMVEQHPAAVAQLQAIAAKLGAAAAQVRRGDGVAALNAQAPGALDLVFLDPPFGGDLLGRAAQAAARVLAPGGLLYMESALGQPWPTVPGCQVHREGNAGAVAFGLWRAGDEPRA
jgi:16S rRNA (guanine966-N2)-methyltransferase